MTAQERIFLHGAVYQRLKDEENAAVLEVGTWKGGGSTLQIATAIKNTGRNHILHTCETDIQLFTQAVESYSNNDLNKFIRFNNIPSTALIDRMIDENNIPKFVFFDGPEDPAINLEDFKRIDEHLKPGAQFCMHDWDLDVRIDGLVSTKAKLLRPYLENSKNWRQLSNLTKPVSVGIVLMEKY